MPALLLLLLLTIPRQAYTAQAREFHFRNQEILSFRMTAEEWGGFSSKVYRFVTKKIADPRPEEPIEIVFDPEMECAGFVSREQGREIRISARIRSHVDFQVILAHELTHVFRHHFQPEEETWLDEGLAKWIEWSYVGDFPTHYATVLKEKRVVDLTDHAFDCGSGSGYADAYFLMLYLHNHLGGARFISELSRSTEKGWNAVETVATKLRTSGVIKLDPRWLTRHSMIRHFSLALLFNDPFAADFALLQIDPRLTSLPIRRVSAGAGGGCTGFLVTPERIRKASGQGDIEICPL